MLKVKAISTVSFVGESENLLRQLTCPASKYYRDSHFYYKSLLYRIEKPEDAKVRVVVFSALDLFCCYDSLVDMVDYPKTILYLTDIKKARRMGLAINPQKLSYMLECPVIFATRGAGGINKLLAAIHTVSVTPNYISVFENPSLLVKNAISLKTSIFVKIFIKLKNLVNNNKKFLY